VKSAIYKKLYDLAPYVVKNGFLGYVCNSMPINFGVELTNICDANCTFCGYRFQERKKGVMDYEVFKRAVDSYCDIGGGTLSLTPTVGEQLLDRDLVNKIGYARKKKQITQIWFYTNLISLSLHALDDLLLSGVSLRISTCIKDRDTYKSLYGVDRYNDVLDNIVRICERNNQLNNPAQIKLFLRVPKPFENIRQSNDYKIVSKYFKSDDIVFLDDLYDSWGGRIKESDLPFGNKIYKINYDIMKEPCYELYRRMNVLYDGAVNVCVCRDINADLRIGNILKQNILDIWRGNALRELRLKWIEGKVPEVCHGCQRYIPLSVFYQKRNKDITIKYLRRIFM